MSSRFDSSDHDARAPRRSTAGFRKRWLILPAILALVWFAPAIIALTPLKQVAIDRAVPELKGQISVGSASLGWLSPVVVRNVVWRDAQGTTLAEVPTLRVERSLYQLLSDSSDLGTIRVQQPKLSLAVRDEGSNIEDALAPFLAKPATNTAIPILTVIVEQATADITDSVGQVTWQLADVNVSLTLPPIGNEPAQAKLTATIHDAAGLHHSLAATYAWHAPSAQPLANDPGCTLALQSQQLPLALLRPLVRRALPGAELSGALTSDVTYTRNADGSQQQLLLTRVSGSDLRFAAPQYTGNDVLRSSQLAASGQIDLLGGQAKLQNVVLASDMASLSAAGQVDQELLSAPSLAAALQAKDYELRGEIDLAKLAAMLPNTLRVREGTEITSGRLSLELVSRAEGNKHRWDGTLKSSQLAARQNGREIVWDQPIAIALAAQQSATGPVIERLTCDASFLKLQARGRLDQGELTAQGDLAQLLAEANRFLALDDMRLAGKLAAEVDWQRAGEQDFQAQGQANIVDFVLETPGRQPWRESQLTIDLAANGFAGATGLRRLNTADVRVIAADDQALVSLSSPVDAPTLDSSWPLRMSLRGDLARWLPRLQGWLPLQDWQAAGAIAAEASLVSSPAELRVQSSKIDITNLAARGAGLNIQEREVHFAADGVWNYRTRQFTSETMILAGSAIALRGDKLLMEPRGNAVALAGEIGYRCDLRQLLAWGQDPQTPSTRVWQGEGVGRVKFTHQDNITVAKWTNEFNKVELYELELPQPIAGVAPVSAPQPQWKPRFKTPQTITFGGDGDYDHARDSLRMTALQINSDMLRVTARCQIDAATTAPVIDLTGETSCDLQKAAEFLSGTIGPGLVMSGIDERKFQLRGPLPSYQMVASTGAPASAKLVWPQELVGQAGIAWRQAEAYKLPIGAGSLDAALQAGVINFAPLDVAVSDGKLKAFPRIVLNNDPMVFQLAKGTQVDQVQITQEMCQTWLKFVAPLLADATRAEGKFSLNIEGATLPLMEPTKGDVRSMLSVHGARVGPGPLATQYVMIAQQVRSILERKPFDANFRPETVQFVTLPQQDVGVQLAEGRVHHRGLQMLIGDTTVVSSGSVGLDDQSLNLLLEVPIRDEWIAKDRLLAGLRGQSIKVPLTGTINRPTPDSRALQQLAGQMIGNAASGLLEQELQKGLDKLFKPK